MNVKKILVPVDFSEPSEKAMSVAIDIARAVGAAIHVVHVIAIVPYMGPAFAPGPGFYVDLHEQTRKGFDEYLAGLAKRGVKATSTLAEGVAYAEINRVAAEIGADLVVIGTHGRTGFQRALLGSVAERVIRTSRVPVMVVPAEEAPPQK
jgi:nucleotide-binding universal stress UspA family protein